MIKKSFEPLWRLLGFLNPFRLIRRSWLGFGNWRRSHAKIDYVHFMLPAEMPALSEERGFIERRIFGKPAMSLADLELHFQRIADDPRPQGVILTIRGFEMSLAQLQTLRMSIERLRERGKRVVCYAQDYDMASYYVASIADEIILQPGGVLFTLGLQQQVILLKDTLNLLGISLDVVAISPYKSAMDSFTNTELTPESRAQLEWLLDSRFEMIVETMAEERNMTAEAVRTLIDNAPYIESEALENRLIDTSINEESLAQHLNAEDIVPWENAQRRLFKKWRKPSRKYVALLNISGTIISGESRTPPSIPLPIPIPFAGDEMAGDETVVQQARQLMQDEDAAAVILYIDSPGGSSAASEAMAAALSELAKTRPVVACMGSVAASGGYYVATPAQWIIAQPGTITGSIGVVFAKLVAGGAYEKLNARRVELQRGKNAGLMGESAPLTDKQRTAIRKIIERSYELFVRRVAASRNMSFEAVNAISGGRVWTGAQAKENGLVDELGDLKAALHKARELANLDENAPLIVFEGDDKPEPPQLAKAAEDLHPTAALAYSYEMTRTIFNGKPQMLMPFRIK